MSKLEMNQTEFQSVKMNLCRRLNRTERSMQVGQLDLSNMNEIRIDRWKFTIGEN